MFSIVTPLHNKGPYVAETINSVLSQTLTSWEMLVVENGSSDAGPKVVTEYANCDQRIRLLHAPQEVRGPGAARNYGLKFASGEWILFLDADDLLLPHYLETMLSTAKKNPLANLIVSRWGEFDGLPQKFSQIKSPVWQNEKRQVLDFAISCAPWVLHSAIVKNSLIHRTGLWPVELDSYVAEDCAFWFQTLLDANLAWSDAVGALYRLGLSNSRGSESNARIWIQSMLAIIGCNTALAERKGILLTQNQIRCILRVLEERIWLAYRTGAADAATPALKEAQRWLSRLQSKSLKYALRKTIGIKNALYFEKALSFAGRKIYGFGK